jgi:small subunit ribosomal protein S17e
MGRIKEAMIKRLGDELLKDHREKFSTDFEKNKQVIKELVEIKSKKLRNTLAGYITKVMRRKR